MTPAVEFSVNAAIGLPHHEEPVAGAKHNSDQRAYGQPIRRGMEAFHSDVGRKNGGGHHENEEHAAKQPTLDEKFFQRVVSKRRPFLIVHDICP
jgi:hypothetical protein